MLVATRQRRISAATMTSPTTPTECARPVTLSSTTRRRSRHIPIEERLKIESETNNNLEYIYCL